jgi:hypothetical protein
MRLLQLLRQPLALILCCGQLLRQGCQVLIFSASLEWMEASGSPGVAKVSGVRKAVVDVWQHGAKM